MESKNKLFAFKLAAKEDAKRDARAEANPGKWHAREGVAIAGCTDNRFATRFASTLGVPDAGVFC